MMNIMRKFIGFIFVVCLSISLFGCKCNLDERELGVWWWNDSLDSKYLTFARDNGVSEIYYCSDDFNEDVSSFIGKANEMGMKVYYLAGEYEWLTDSSNLYSKINSYIIYQNNYNKFSGIHLDIEPHQDPTFDDNREELITSLIELASDLKKEYTDITFDYDLPFWLEDEIEFNGVRKEAYKHMIDIANRVFLMSYRDSSEKIYDISKEEIEYAKSVNKVLFLGVETKSDEGDNVSFQEEGKEYLYEQLFNLHQTLPSNFGLSIHQIKTWYELKEK